MTPAHHASERCARRSPGCRRATLAAALAALAAGLGCSAVQAGRRSPGTLANGAFTPGQPPAAQYGGPTSLTCPTGGPNKVFTDALAAAAKDAGKPAPEQDGRLCAVADTYLGWTEAELPPESVNRFVSSYFGLAAPVQRVVIATIETDDPRTLTDRFLDTANNFVAQATQPRYGLVTQRQSTRGRDLRQQQSSPNAAASTKVALVMQDAAVDLQPTPRQVPANGNLGLSGKLLGGRTNPKVFACTPSGKLETPATQPGDAFNVQIPCGDRPGPMEIEVRGEKDGAPSPVARFAVGCGAELAKAAPVAPTPAKAQPPPANEQERQMFDRLNAIRRDAGLAPLAWDDAASKVAREASESYKSGSSSFDVAASLKQNEIPSLTVLQNPVAAPDVDEANALVASSPVNRCNILNREVTHAGVGVLQTSDPNGRPIIYVTELLVRELPQVDVQEVRAKLRDAIARKRTDARAPAVAPDPMLEDIAQKYAQALASTKGSLPKAQDSEIVAPLYRSFKNVNILSGVKSDPLEFAEESGVTGAAKGMGVGAAQGANPVLGKNAVYVVVLLGTRK
jgi:uncharacterized protein YkwD